MVIVGVEVTVVPVLIFKVAAGAQVKASAPLAVRVTEKPAHKVKLAVLEIVGNGVKAIIVVLVALQLEVVPVMV